jgi:predicted transcriptional regulator of viral defense system
MSKKTTKYDKLLRLARKGPIRARDLDKTGIPRVYLRRLSDRGLLVRTDRGVYRLADEDATEHTALADVALRAPEATICLYSALQVHGLTTEIAHSVWIMIDRHARAPKISYPPIEVVRASGPVADCFRYERHVGRDTALEALRDYFRTHRGGVDKLAEAARADRVYTKMRPYMEALI